MDGQYSSRGNYGGHNYNSYGRMRPYHDHRYQTSPHYSGPGDPQHGPPHSNAPWRGGRGRGGPPQTTGSGPAYNSSPPHRQSNYPSGGYTQAPYYQQSPYPASGNQPGYHNSGYRGSRGRGRGYHHDTGSDRRFSGPHDYRGGHRGRGGNFTNLQWNAPRGVRPGGDIATGPNSIQASPAPSSHSAREAYDDVPDEEDARRQSKETPEDQQRPHFDAAPDPTADSQPKDSKFSFAFKTKTNQLTPAKPPPDLSPKAKGSARAQNTRPAPATTPAPESKPSRTDDGRAEQAHDRPDRGPDFRNEKRDPSHRREQRPSYAKEVRSRPSSPSPPAKKKQMVHVRRKPTLTAEEAASESVYYRKAGNESVVGAGTYGKVFKASHIYTKDMVALKKIRMEGERDGFPITATREIKLLQTLRHRHVVALQEVMVEKNECFMVFEYLSHDLTGLINHPTFKLTEAHKKDLARQMFDGLNYLHKRGVLHRDIKAANILISSTGQLKYADFGLARFYQKKRAQDYTNRVITIWYRPPELLLGETKYGPEVDVWSAACVFMEMFTRKAVFPGEGGEISQLDKVYSILGTPTTSEWPDIVEMAWVDMMMPCLERRRRTFETLFTPLLSPAALELVQWMFKYDPAKRPSAEDVLRHRYFLAEQPAAQQAYELAEVEGDWHEFESKAHRRENDRREKERKKEEYLRDREKRRVKEVEVEAEAEAEAEAETQEQAREQEPEPEQERDQEQALTAVISAGTEVAVMMNGVDDRGDRDQSDGEGSARMSMS